MLNEHKTWKQHKKQGRSLQTTTILIVDQTALHQKFFATVTFVLYVEILQLSGFDR
jgi:hypothetical protein